MIKKIAILILLFIHSICLYSCSDEGQTKTKTITIINTVNNLETKIKLTSDYFYLEDLPDFNDFDYYFLGYSYKNDGEYLKSGYAYPLKESVKLYAEFSVSKQSFNIDSIGNVYLQVSEAITSKETYVLGTVEINDENYTLDTTQLQIRLRGNSSLGVPKKSYKLKFDKKVDIFSFGEDKEWALIANYYDPTHLRNYYAYKLAKAMGMEYSVDCKFVNVFLNGADQGLYLLCETVKTSSNRVDIEDGYNINSIEIPFLLELDFKLEENNPNYVKELLDKEFFFLDNRPYNGKKYQFATKYPKTFTSKDITDAQYKYIKNYMHAVYDSVRNGLYEHYIDVDSFIDYFIIQELFLNIDQDYSSVFMYKPYGEKLHFGPVWDFDLSTGNCSYVGNYTPFMQMKDVNGGNYLFVELMKYDDFRNKFITKLKELDKFIIPTMMYSFYYNYDIIDDYTENDNNIWNNLNEPNWARPEWLLNKTYNQQYNYLQNFIEQHYYWMIQNM